MLDYLTTHSSISPIWRGFAPGFVKYKKGYTRLAATSDKVYQLLAHGWWFSAAQSQVVGDSLWALWLLPPLTLVAMI
jgi:hypothetical protein